MATKNKNHYIVILCGGTGPRLWPLSRVAFPKQFLKIFSNNSILKETFLRAKKIVPQKNIYIVTNQKYLSLIRKDLGKNFPLSQILCEPDKKNTAMALIFASAVISRLNPEAIITSFPSDHYIGKIDNFIKDINKSFQLAKQSKIILLGINPTSPNPAYGYFLTGKNFLITKFIEKPSIPQALKLISQQNCYWNSGIYTYKITTLLGEFKKYAKDYLPLFDQIYQHPNNPKVLAKIYSLSRNLAIDTAISEKSKELISIPVSFSWNDVGQWSAILQLLTTKKQPITALNKNQKVVFVDSKNCLVHTPAKKIIGLVNMEDTAIIDTPDALLVCNLKNGGSYQVRDLITKMVADPELKKFFTGKYG